MGFGLLCFRQYYSSCDIDNVCINLALHFDANYAKMEGHHVFLNVLDQLPLEARKWLMENGYQEKSEPAKKKAKQDMQGKNKNELKAKRLVQCREMQMFMLKSAGKLFLPDTRADCARHTRQCCSCSYEVARAPASAKQALITAEIVGTSCQEDSPLGSHLGEAGDNILSASVWAAKLRATRPVFFVHECHKNFSPKFFDIMLEDQYQIFTIDGVDPETHGWPVHRRGRRYTWGVRRDYVLCGSIDNFKQEFTFKLGCSGKTLYVAPQNEVDKEFKKLLKARKFSESIPAEAAGPWEGYYTPSMRDRLRAAQRYFIEKNEGVTEMTEMNADIEQNVGAGPSPGLLVPTLVTHGRIYNTHLGRHATALEHLVMQGVPVYGELQRRMGLKRLPWADYLKNLPEAAIKKLAGNAMFLPSVIYQQLYLLSRLRTRSSMQPTNMLRWRRNTLEDLDITGFDDDV